MRNEDRVTPRPVMDADESVLRGGRLATQYAKAHRLTVAVHTTSAALLARAWVSWHSAAVG